MGIDYVQSIELNLSKVERITLTIHGPRIICQLSNKYTFNILYMLTDK